MPLLMRPLLTTSNQLAGTAARATAGLPIAGTCTGIWFAIGPSPMPVSPWHGAHFSV